MNQGELLDELFYGLHAESKEPIIFDGASVNRWLKGTERVSPVISRYYLKKRNQEKLANDIEQYILPLMYDSDMAVQELYRDADVLSEMCFSGDIPLDKSKHRE